MIVTITTDGACFPNPGVGGWAAIFRMAEHSKVLYGFERNSTNIRMELTAAIMALEHLKRPCEVALTTDSLFVINGITKWINRWKMNDYKTLPWKNNLPKDVMNRDLWERLDKARERHVITWIHVRGHGTHQDNILCDSWAVKARVNLISGEEVLGKPATTQEKSTQELSDTQTRIIISDGI